jgi:hypothetical protein
MYLFLSSQYDSKQEAKLKQQLSSWRNWQVYVYNQLCNDITIDDM